MESTAKQYETAVNNAAEISQVLLDMEGGKYVLALFSELLQELLDEGNISGATSIVRKLHGAAEVPFELDALDESNITAWIVPFSEILGGILEEVIF
jgi:hypothetical protein